MKLTPIPQPLFATVMGLAGVSLAFRRTTIDEIALGFAIFATAIWIALTLGFLYKVAVSPGVVGADLLHPITSSFFAAIPLGGLLSVASLKGFIAEPILTPVWCFIAVLQILIMLAVMWVWMRPEVTTTHVTPAWFLPLVGNLVAPLYSFDLFPDASWFFFGIGVITWLGVLPVVWNRMFLHDQRIPLPLRPTIFILIAPPALITINIFNFGLLSPTDSIAYGLLGVTTFFSFLVAVRLPDIIRAPFGLPWWASTFPSAALASVLFNFSTIAGWVVLVPLSIWVSYLSVRTTRAYFRGQFHAG